MRIGEKGMSLIDKDFIDELSTWAEKNEDKTVFPQIDDNVDSYYINRDSEQTYIMEYSFKTLQELKECLIEISGLPSDSEILKLMTVGVCQERFRGKSEILSNKSQTVKVDNSHQDLPEYVYVF
jgi:hypothetical protein